MGKRKKIVLKFGGECNLNCSYCHCMRSHYEYNPDIIKWINDNGIEEVHMCGGEPFLYFDLMKEIIPQLTTVKEFHTTTNGTLLDDEKVDFCNKYNIITAVSIDGGDSKRDLSKLPNYDAVAKIGVNGVSSVFCHGNTDLERMITDARRIGKAYGMMCGISVTNVPAFVHQTEYSPNEETTREDAQSYAAQFGRLIEHGFLNYEPTGSIYSLHAAHAFIRHYINHDPYEVGCRCCNPKNVSLTIDGRFLLCPYGEKFIGDIYTGVDWGLVESYIPERCKGCKFRPICGCSCVANITENECYIFRVLYRHYKKILKKYHINEEELLNRPEWKRLLNESDS